MYHVPASPVPCPVQLSEAFPIRNALDNVDELNGKKSDLRTTNRSGNHKPIKSRYFDTFDTYDLKDIF